MIIGLNLTKVESNTASQGNLLTRASEEETKPSAALSRSTKLWPV